MKSMQTIGVIGTGEIAVCTWKLCERFPGSWPEDTT